MDCKTARLLLDFQRPRPAELSPDEAAELQRHLASCADCEAFGRAERRLDDHLGRAVRAVPVPDGLRDRLLAGLRERRQAVVRRRLAWAARVSAVAAAVALVGFLVWWRAGAFRPEKVNTQAALDADFEKYGSRTPDRVQDWFQNQRHVKMVAPKVFDYGYLADYDMATFQGKPVPKLVFQRAEESGITRARVFVLTREQFDVAELPTNEGEEVESLGRRLRGWESPESPNTVYVAIYEGENLLPLLDPTQPHPQ